MLGKLFKHEMKSYCLPAGITLLAGVVVTLLMKIISLLPVADENGRYLLQMLSFYGFYYLIALVGVAMEVFVVVRFFNTMVADRGYLTFTLPVKTSTHIWSKLFAGVLWQLIASAFVMISRLLFMAGGYWCDEIQELKDIFHELSDVLPEFQAKYIVTILLAVLLIIVWNFVPFLMIYMCIAIGQLFGKWRIFASIASFFILVICLYIVGIAGIMSLVVAAPDVSFDFFANASAYAIVNGVVGTMLGVGVIAFIVFFAITNRLFDKHLNLE